VTYAAEEGYPDGVTVDAEGCVWVAHWAGARITRLSSTGERKQVFTVPVPNVTSICFGGADLCTLFVTTAWEGTPDRAAYPYAGDVFALNPGVRGLAEPHFHCSWNA
jgi:sugar lactone lactonase YvrE